MGIMVMPYYPQGSVGKYKWSPESYATLRMCMSQIICSLMQAYETTQLIHNDTHLDNIIISKTTKPSIPYTISGKRIDVPTNGFRITIMDYELVTREMPEYKGAGRKFLYKDIRRVFSDLYYTSNLNVSNHMGLDSVITQLEDANISLYVGLANILLQLDKLKFETKLTQLSPPLYNPQMLGGCGVHP